MPHVNCAVHLCWYTCGRRCVKGRINLRGSVGRKSFELEKEGLLRAARHRNARQLGYKLFTRRMIKGNTVPRVSCGLA